MAQLSLYLNASVLKKIEKAAEFEKTSLSNWVSKRLTAMFESGWPAGYEKTFGSFKDKSFKRQPQGSHKKDARRITF